MVLTVVFHLLFGWVGYSLFLSTWGDMAGHDGHLLGFCMLDKWEMGRLGQIDRVEGGAMIIMTFFVLIFWL